jgi:hypothetical protein
VIRLECTFVLWEEYMQIENEKDVLHVVNSDQWMMDILKATSSLNLPDWWVCAGFVRSKIWDVLHGFSERTSIPDVDVVYFDKSNLDELEEKRLEEVLHNILPGVPWSVKNEARMHSVNGMPPYTSTIDAISKFPETATALGLKLDGQGDVMLSAPCGIHDVIKLEVKPTPYFIQNKKLSKIYESRILQKNWKVTWNMIKVHQMSSIRDRKVEVFEKK